ncbi:hypothetical protein [Lysinibacillus sp. K60]|uniref:hypothetical protein n=1 Tax=Lysinibacillus sp. K60 TaxID=2720027 RepID=UPI001C8B21AF|nr:hypothetical protein [Lysinibacillus sp. K60]MBX8945851.1 hypothetical protein [Lysinibacillus sp. K60]
MRFLFVILTIMLIPVFYVVVLSFQDSQILEGTIQQKNFQEKKCTQEPTFDPALNMVMLKENCEGPNWTITIDNKQYHVTEQLYNKLDINSFYTFSYHPLKGMSLLNE